MLYRFGFLPKDLAGRSPKTLLDHREVVAFKIRVGRGHHNGRFERKDSQRRNVCGRPVVVSD